MKLPLALAALAALATSACGYRVGSQASSALPHVRIIAVPMFRNETFQYQIEQRLTGAVIHELLARTRFRAQSDPDGSDAILQGIVTSISSGPIVFDPKSGRTSKVLLTVGVRISLIDSRTKKSLLDSTDLTFHEPYEVSTDPAKYFAENGPAIGRLSREVAASVVSTIMNTF